MSSLPQRVMKGIRADIVAAFQSFQSDYFNVQTTYLQQNNTASGQQAFANFTIQPVYQLSQQVASSLGAVAVKAEKGQSITSARMFLQNRLLSTSPQSLLGGLNSAIPPVGTTTANSKIYTDVAQGAINAAQVASLNAVSSLHSGAYTGNKHLYGQ